MANKADHQQTIVLMSRWCLLNFVSHYNTIVPLGRKVLHGSARRNCILRVGGFPSSSTHCCNRQPTIMIFFVDCSKYKMWE